MHKTVTVSACAVFALISLSILTGSAMADTLLWTNGGGDGLWDTTHDGYSDNWSPNYTPEIFFNDKAQINLIPGPLIDAGTSAECQYLALADEGEGGLTMTGGTLLVAPELPTQDSWFIIGYGLSDVGTFMLDGGTVTTGNRVFVGFRELGILIMTGGTFNIGGLFGIGVCDVGGTDGIGRVYLDGGTIWAKDFKMSDPPEVDSLLDIAGGTLIINDDKTSLINDYIAAGRIIALGGWGIVGVDYNITNPGRTTVTGLVDPQKAANPSPANNAENVRPDVTLGWMPGEGATSHDVYFGTITPPPFIGNQIAMTFTPDTLLVPNTTYYWRINEINGLNTIIGYVWKFTTASDMATNPDPNDGAAGVALDKVLSWTPGYGAASHNVYLGTDENGIRLTGDLNLNGIVDGNDLLILIEHWLDPSSVIAANLDRQGCVDFRDFALLAQNWKISSSSFFIDNIYFNYIDPGNFEPNTTYYWRIDEVNGPNTVKGDVWNFTTSNSNYSLYGKIMCGYQGWFACPGDGWSSNWKHWSSGSLFDYTHLKVEMWPDTTEYARKYEATGFASGGNHYYVFSSYDSNTTMVHFKWMQEYGIDGVFVQRFGSDFGIKPFMNTVLSNVKIAANAYGRKYAVMYDFTNWNPSTLITDIQSDWTNLETVYGISNDPDDDAYIKHNGKPVIAIYGIGWFGGYADMAKVATLIQWFKDRGFTVMIGVNNDWRTRTSDTNFQLCVSKADIIMPWNVGCYDNIPGGKIDVGPYCTNNWVPDLNWCNTNNKDYSVCIFPGFSWHNWNVGSFNEIPRQGGQFLWDQVYLAKSNGAEMIYVAMFDEVDEGTAIFKVSNNPPPPSGGVEFLTLEGLPSDEYLWLVGQASRGMRGEITVNPTRPPARP